MDQIGSNQIKMNQTWNNTNRWVTVFGSNWNKMNQNGSKCIKMNHNESNLNKLDF